MQFFRPFLSLFLLLSLLSSTSCQENRNAPSHKRQADERKAQIYLRAARAALEQRAFEQAKTHIIDMRKSCRLALTARENGILIMDSIDLLAAQYRLQQIDSLMQTTPYKDNTSDEAKALNQKFEAQCQEIKFYQRKLQHDLQQRHRHE